MRLALVASGALTLLLGLSRIVYPHDLGQYEADVWAPADAIAHGHTPYHMSAAMMPPYTVASYGPLYYALIAIGVRLFGNQFAFGRALGLLALGACAVSVYLILQRFAGGRSRLVPLLGAGLFLAQYPVQAEAGIEAPDMVGLALALSGLAVVFTGALTASRRDFRSPALAGVLLAAAVLVRQTLFLPVLVALAWYALRGHRRRALVVGLVVVLLGAAVFAVLQSTSGGGFLWHAVRLQAATALTAGHARTLTLTYLKSPATLGTLALLLLGMLAGPRAEPAAGQDEEGSLRRLLVVYLVAAAVLAAVTSGKVGASINYWLEVSAVLSLLVPLVVRTALDGWDRSGARLWSAPNGSFVLVVLIVGAALVNLVREAHGEYLQWKALPYVNEVVRDLRALTHPRERVYVEYPDLAVSAGRPYVFNDLALYEDSTLLRGIYRRVLRSDSLRLIVSLEPASPAGYATVCMRHLAPAGVYDVHVYYRVSGRAAPGQCVPA